MNVNGTVGVLNVGAGDITLSFDKNNPADCIRAGRIVKDLIRRGYALLVEVTPGKYQRAKDFDENTSEYIVADFDPMAADADSDPWAGRIQRVAEIDVAHNISESVEKELAEEQGGQSSAVETDHPADNRAEGGQGQPQGTDAWQWPTGEQWTEPPAPEQPKRRGRPPTKHIDASTTRAVAVGRTAGG